MLALRDVTLKLGTKVLLNQASLRLEQGWKVGLVGRNGAGKTSLFKLIAKKLQEDEGEIVVAPTWQIGYLSQELPSTNQTVLAYVRSGDTAWERLQREMAVAEAAKDGMKLAALYAEMEVIDGYSIDSRVAIVLKGLGFEEDAYSRPVTSFSGGWQMRLQLARLLMSRADLLLLDEPTNHLDLESIFWLERWLNTYQGTAIVISHDRCFLDHITSHVVHVVNQRLTLYQGNYTSFISQFQAALILEKKMNQKVMQQKAHLQRFVDRFRAKASKAKQAQSRLKAIAKLQTSCEFQEEVALSFEFFPSKKIGYPSIAIRASLGYQGKTILNDVRLNIGDGDCIGVIGVNGSGKSTLLKSIAKTLDVVSGEIIYHPDVTMGYFSQQLVDQFQDDDTPLGYLLRQDDKLTESNARNFLGQFGFNQNRVFEPIGVFSGGEKARLALASLIWQRPNVLLLDEPTNHLDMYAREALMMALQCFSGAMIVISHDRHFIECCVNELWWVHAGQVQPFSGNLQDYEVETLQALPIQRQQQKQTVAHKSSPSRQQGNKQREKKIQRLEREIVALQQKIHAIEEALADTALYTGDRLDEINRLGFQQRALQSELNDKEEAWLRLSA